MERTELVLIGVMSFVAQIGLVVSAKFESATNVALLRKAFDVIFAFVFQILFFHVSTQRYFACLSILANIISFLGFARSPECDRNVVHLISGFLVGCQEII